MPAPTAWQQHRHALLGVGYLVVLALLVSVSIAAYNKDLPWQRTAHVEVLTTRAGLELNKYADVKLQGRVVGEVRDIRSRDGRTVIELGIQPDELERIPADVDAAIVPKTLFGQKYVDLLPRTTGPAGRGASGTAAASASGPRLTDGATIEQTATATEIGDVYDKLVPVLRAIDPARLSTVLTTLAATLEGRGGQVRDTLDNLDTFLAELDPHLDTLDTDLRLLARTLDGYDAAAPDVLTNLANVTALTEDLLVPAEKRLGRFLATLTDLSDTAREVLAENRDDLVRLVVRGEPLTALLAEYSPMLACSIDGLRRVDLHGNQTTGARGPYVLLSIDMFIVRQPYSAPADLPSNPESDAALDTLPAPIRSWEPHCPRFGQQVHEAVDALPRSLPALPNQVITSEHGDERTPQPQAGSSARSRAVDVEGRRLAVATALARDLLARLDGSAGEDGEDEERGDAELGGLLIAPLLGGDPLEVP
ncbi:phospholipid/cholesterol/gamma-HCH transport system substrate-binding protein [Nocardioides sp. J9]|uniref:MCE family protein n=1 Tax=Nocardioides sp. J9 TaxID=935844 RepID=UPI0011A2E0E1|nr:MCE family protein [Nocardioides sp. J9]TWH02701.1 phospholipid/cholesterol/gamma-HCH transport system substrate-binding protein [Nocardioides sp. J9]